MTNVLLAASECVPFIKTGGLADVVGALPKYFDKEKYDVRVVIPKYTCIDERYRHLIVHQLYFYMDFNGCDNYVGVEYCDYEGVKVYFIDNESIFGGMTPYNGMPWDIGRFAFFCKAALGMLPLIGWRPDVIHCNDWQTGLMPVYLNERFQGDPFFHNIKTIMTIHNLQFQGIWDYKEVSRVTGLSPYYFTPDKLEYKKDANLLKGGMVFADAITTVSETYAEEIKTEYYGEGLDGLLRARSGQLCGIVNGIDYEVFDPETDEKIFKQYNVRNFRTRKVINKTELQKQLGLEVDKKVCMIGIVSRLTSQKGFDLIANRMDELCSRYMQLVVLGTGEEQYENMFRYYESRYPGKVAVNICYSDELARRIYAGCDAFLMPSRFEPCGLSQLMSMRYGTLPIVRETGGLKDTVEPYNEFENTGTGYSFANYNAHEMMKIIDYALNTYYDHKPKWNKMAERAMQKNFSWEVSAEKYRELYEKLLGRA